MKSSSEGGWYGAMDVYYVGGANVQILRIKLKGSLAVMWLLWILQGGIDVQRASAIKLAIKI
jgi:hypothetical protein